jgi:hypothetical protein
VRLGENNPELITQLQDLILIETRPDWRQWADRQLAIELNAALDRGPETPEFNTGRERRETGEKEPAQNIIDLTPANQPAAKDESSRLPEPKRSLSTELAVPPAAELIGPAVESKPLSVQDEGSFESLPPSIDVEPERELRDYLR